MEPGGRKVSGAGESWAALTSHQCHGIQMLPLQSRNPHPHKATTDSGVLLPHDEDGGHDFDSPRNFSFSPPYVSPTH